MTAQPQSQMPQKLSECRKCRDSGFPGIMIGFTQGGVKKDGKPFWNLVNKDNSAHVHLSALTPTITTQSQAPTVQTTQATVATNETATKDQVQDRINQSHQENIAAWDRQTAALKELSSAILILATAINNRVIK